jgi:hypothetical protein
VTAEEVGLSLGNQYSIAVLFSGKELNLVFLPSLPGPERLTTFDCLMLLYQVKSQGRKCRPTCLSELAVSRRCLDADVSLSNSDFFKSETPANKSKRGWTCIWKYLEIIKYFNNFLPQHFHHFRRFIQVLQTFEMNSFR